jgi:DNA-binding transcriptional MerR regulator
VLRYWEEQGLISPTREHRKLRYSPRDVAIAGLIRQLLEAGGGIEGIRMLKRLADRDTRRNSAAADRQRSSRTLRILYQRKAFREETGMDEEHDPDGKPPPPPPHHGPPRGPRPRGGPRG